MHAETADDVLTFTEHVFGIYFVPTERVIPWTGAVGGGGSVSTVFSL